MNRIQRSNLLGDFQSIKSFEESIDVVLTYIMDQCDIAYAYLYINIEDSIICISKGNIDVNIITPFHTSIEKVIQKDSINEKLSFSIANDLSFAILAGFPIYQDDKRRIGTLCFLDSDFKLIPTSQIKTIEFGVKQIQFLIMSCCNYLSLQKKLVIQQDKFDLFTENSKEILFELSLEGNFLSLSDSWITEMGYTIDEGVGKNTVNFLHPDDQEYVGNFLSRLVPNERCNEIITYRIKHKKGHYVWHSSNIKFIAKEGECFFIGNCRDVTAFINAQEEVTKQKEFYGKILDRLPIDLGVWDENHRYLYLNQAAIKNDELRKFIIGKDDFEYAIHTGRDDSFAKSRREKFLKALESKQVAEWEDTIIAQNGEQFFHTRKFIPIYNEDGSFDMMTGYGIDITESKKINEEILRSRQLITNVIQNAAVGIIVQGPQSEFLEYNKSACEMLGLTEDQMLGKTSFDPHWKVIHKNGTEFRSHEHPVPQAIEKRVPIKNIVMGVHRPITNDLAWLLVDAIPVFDDLGELVYVVCTFNDITARKKAEDALKVSNERFTYASEATSDALWDWNMITNEIFVGESYSQLFGYQFENNIIPGEFCENLVHPDDKEAYESSIDKAIEEGKNKWSHVYRYLKANGNYAYVSDKAIIIRDAEGNPVRMIGAMQDITQEKQLKDELLQSEERFKGAFFNSSFGMAIVDLEGYWAEVNDKMCEILGYTKEEFRELTFLDITYEGDLEEDLYYKNQIETRKMPNFNMEKRYIHKDKSLVWVHLSVSVVKNRADEIQHYVAQVIDISQRKRMEEENRILIEENNRNKALQLDEAKNMYRLLADNTIDLVCLHNLDASFKYVSPSIHALLGYEAEDLIGKLPENYVHPDDLERFKKRIGGSINSRSRFSEQVRLKNSKGEYAWFETNAAIVFENNVPVGFQSSTRDITQRKKAEKIIEDTLIQERQLNELRTNLVSTISHEFRTPMTTIRTSAELITMYLQNNDFQHAQLVEKRVDTITQEIDRIVELMDAVLTISKDDAGKTSFNPVSCDIKEICLDVIENSFNHQKDNRKVDITFDAKQAIIFADSNLIKYTLFNVLNNAFKYSEGCGNVKLNLFTQDEKVFIEVIDNGIGIPEEDQPKLFNTFFRASNSNGIQGTGLGLYIIKMFTKKNSGKVKLESQLGKGTKVTLRFPLSN